MSGEKFKNFNQIPWFTMVIYWTTYFLPWLQINVQVGSGTGTGWILNGSRIRAFFLCQQWDQQGIFYDKTLITNKQYRQSLSVPWVDNVFHSVAVHTFRSVEKLWKGEQRRCRHWILGRCSVVRDSVADPHVFWPPGSGSGSFYH